MKLHNHVQVCMMNSNRDCFTTHGLHMNAKGKDWLVNTWGLYYQILTIYLPINNRHPSTGSVYKP